MSFASSLASYNWKEVTDEFKNACKELQIGELLKDHSFGLFEAMSAIEMMDPKMDAGMMENQAQTNIKSFKQAVDDKIVKVDNFDMDEKVAIVDNTLCNLITWLDGASLAQTVFTNLYLHDPNLIEDAYIKCFSLAILKIVDWMRNKITTSATFEEEDFQPMNYNFKFASDVADSSVLSMLKSSEDTSAKHYRHLKGEQKTDEQQVQVDLAFALWMRIKFVRVLFQILQFNDEHVAFSKNIEEINKHINNGLESLLKVKETHKLGKEPKMVKIAKTTYPVVMGFEPSINQRLLPPTFPRFIRIFSFEATCDYLKEILVKLSEACKIGELTTFQQLLDFGLAYSKVNSIFLRSMFQLIALPRTPLDKILKMKDILLNSVQKFISPPILSSKFQIPNRDVCAQFADNFLNKCTPVFINLLQILGHNNARQREKFGHILEEFSNLQEDADTLDRIIQSYITQQKLVIPNMPCFSSWILNNNLSLMRLYLITGFELDLFSKFEYYYVYWYLCEVILKWQTNTLNRADNFLLSLEQFTSNSQKSAKKASKKKVKSVYEKEISVLTAERHMYSAYYQSLRGLKEENALKSPNEDFDCEEFRYSHRFAPFQFFQTPPVCMYHQYRATDAHFVKSVNVQKMYAFAQEHFEIARSIYEKHPEYQPFSKIAKTNFVVLRLLSSGLKKCQNLEIDFAENNHFPLIRL